MVCSKNQALTPIGGSFSTDPQRRHQECLLTTYSWWVQKIQKDLFSILVRFRLHQVALPADFANLYRQIDLVKVGKNYHRLLWKDPSSEPIELIRMTQVIYGLAPSFFHSIWPLKVLAEETTNTKRPLS